ncbi:unnamed protein product [Fraxinus pennsylvanica]|uniref:Uncharacterized protein n=1 Tax=Fraxinus pennsylvanica TaxID=56036 RepID=A0AAD2DS94_9LAMI|nr:unnamed protein product [Fraxinus pennsylvanica]
MNAQKLVQIPNTWVFFIQELRLRKRLQEIIPLNAGNIFGADDSRLVSKWENIIRENLNKIPPVTKLKCYSDHASPSRFKPSEDALDIEDEILLESDSDLEEKIYLLDEEPNNLDEIKDGMVGGENFIDVDTLVSKVEQRQFYSPKRLN